MAVVKYFCWGLFGRRVCCNNYGIFLAYFRESGRGFSPSMFWSDQCNYPTRSKLCCLRLSRSPRCVWAVPRSEEHTSELQSHSDLVCRLLLEIKRAHV